MQAPQTPTRAGARGGSSKGPPRTPSVNRLAVAERTVGARVERGEAAPVEAPFAQSARAWRSGGDRKIMFDNRGEASNRSAMCVCLTRGKHGQATGQHPGPAGGWASQHRRKRVYFEWGRWYWSQKARPWPLVRAPCVS